MTDLLDIRERLRHVFWLGGPPDTGKSTVAIGLGERFDIEIYRQDGNEMEHLRRADPERFPHNAELYRRVSEQDEDMFFQSWVDDEPAALFASARDVWKERVGMICEDLLNIGSDRPIVVEGPGLFPEVVMPLLSRPGQAFWLVPTETFKRDSHARRGKSGWRDRTSDPELALRHHIERDLMLADAYRSELVEHDLPWLEIDGSLDADTVTDRVARHFGLGEGRQ